MHLIIIISISHVHQSKAHIDNDMYTVIHGSKSCIYVYTKKMCQYENGWCYSSVVNKKWCKMVLTHQSIHSQISKLRVKNTMSNSILYPHLWEEQEEEEVVACQVCQEVMRP